MTEPEDQPQAPLPSRPSAGGLIGSIIGTLDQALTNRPRPVAAIEERLGEPVEREEPSDRSGARL